LKSQTCPEHLSYVYVLAPTAVRAKARATKYRQGNHPETEIWRACQRSSTVLDEVVCFLLPSDVGPFPGVFC
jgi:hypothetical protein